ncbi:MAG: bifunctional aspartate kinase/homoserine dehydrogenase I, partial [Muribaculaceae bacterium]|nr:bifunctional aspartate kinase/homoserine dehydrogenase I [Muribaculaceae bacterium]
MNVLKFGGTSVGTVESLKNVRSIVEALPSDTVVVVSALGGLTDKLIATARLAAEGGDWIPETDAIANRHYVIIEELVRPECKSRTLSVVDLLLSELRRTYEGVSLIRDLPSKTL